ncbi:hypothetical protein ASPBRDRAFT_364972 [Aspergillus brasiliensis CBS 101740]|uniref:Uncharacterized protein n=1 Tax=Aspergillus brasiliensis (strain CBS 101740 / IMI 381727 / IBT 21946) TaxID=767769 RepID=A0A1L9U4Z9_ASPBC|nr:hypothetical protein ASPBRDRAFT_364972 [Aspergillus brasiliensis CBS 101740]
MMADEDRRPTRNLQLRSSAIVSIAPCSSIAGAYITFLAPLLSPSQLAPDVLPYVIRAPQPGIASTSRSHLSLLILRPRRPTDQADEYQDPLPRRSSTDSFRRLVANTQGYIPTYCLFLSPSSPSLVVSGTS